ncbi:MAG: GAF domain-containing sensor histidine kinase [Anaerolineaceae bacterium]|nr:GAF domain-containing sensor histidine kinase [Anaerolineaceae bacterium]
MQDQQKLTTPKIDAVEEALQVESKPIDDFILENIRRILRALTNLQDFDAFEVYITAPGMSRLEKIYHTGHLDEIWVANAYLQDDSLIRKSFLKGEQRVINLPNSRLAELTDSLKEKAYGQVLCLPIIQKTHSVGMICAAHTRKRFFSNRELNLLGSIADWIASVMDNERRNKQIRAKIVAEERERIGMDLHDGIIQSLYGIGLSLENARMDLSNGKSNGVKEIEKSIKALETAIADIRAYILDLRPRQLRHSNLLESMQNFIREFRANTMIDVILTGSAEEVEGLAKLQMDALYHIFQESLSNTAKHAHATKVQVRLWRQDERVMLRVKDNGAGFEEQKANRRIGHGLINMQVRAEGVGGGIEVISIRRQGTTLTAWMPYIRESIRNV